ncbi:hypothetical protein BJ322DRAFT_1050124 [Thelephora terrestris]|uniref:Uncharacterized protein n=1 Tax=Thelephora terrestris TaxID=56493 RepID=A0A9P6HKH1_9AGAM|nr:hypothetical protein BJ322DRAFT_1050124 [Thelephora terrestris]
MRQLSLHVSALNDLEYNAYTEALHDLIADDQPLSDDYENVSVGAREVRAWLRGRYASMPLSDVDAILKLFYPTLNAQDTFNAGQFFAVMRLVTHARDGKGVSKNLAFTQAHPSGDSGRLFSRPSSRPTSRPPSPSKQAPPPPPSRYTGRRGSQTTSVSDQNPFHRVDRDVDHSLPFLPPNKPPTHPDVNPLALDSTPPVIPYSAYNPFMSRSKSARRAPTQDDLSSKGPPLPPRKPVTMQPGPSSEIPAKSALLSTNPFKPPKPTHLVSPLMKQSLEASRAGVVQRKVEETLNQERVLQVLKSSSVRNRNHSPSKSGPGSSESSISGDLVSDARSDRSVPSLPPRRNARSPHRSAPSVAGSIMSFESVANARLSLHSAKSRGNSHFPRSPERGRSPEVVMTDEPRQVSVSPTRHTDIAPPPMHPDRKPLPLHTSAPEISSAGTSPTHPLSPTSPKVFRSKSMGHPKPPPLPTRRSRTRPESVQILPSSAYDAPTTTPVPSTATDGEFPFQKVSRRVSLGSTHSRASSIDSAPSVKKNLQRTLSALQPKFDAARYKVEAGLSRRGFVDHTTDARPHLIGVWGDEGERNLIGGTDTASVDNDSASVLSYEDDSPGERRGAGYERPRGNTPGVNGSERRGKLGVDRESLKLPVSDSDGWKPL